jgi:hypothetical protein
VAAALALRDDQVQLIAERFVLAEAEDARRGGIPHDDCAARIADDHRITHGLDQLLPVDREDWCAASGLNQFVYVAPTHCRVSFVTGPLARGAAGTVPPHGAGCR